MPTFIPPYLGEQIKSNAERKMYDVLQQLQLKNAYVLHSLGLPKHKHKIYGEIDFVVVCERGVACLEIKGGRVECHEGRWFFTDRYGVEREKAEGPFAQVKDNMFSLRDLLQKRFSKNPHMKNILLACGVVFPDITFHSTSQEIISEIVYDQTVEDISQYMNRVFAYWEERQHREPSKLSPSDIKEIVQYLRGDFCFVPSLGDRLEQVEKKLVRLTSEQVMVLDGLSENDHLLIEGNAGTGKTLLAVWFARKQASQGKKVLYLTYNKNLSHNMEKQLDGISNLKSINLHALFTEYVPFDMAKMQENMQEYFAKILPEQFLEYLECLTTDELLEMQYDQIVVDEGQDIIKPLYLYCLDYLLKGGLEQGHWAFFYDEKQNIYNPDYAEGRELLASYSATSFRLFMNCRNTIQIGTYSAHMSGVELGEFIRENGEEVQKITYEDDVDFKNKMQEILKHLKKENVSMKDVVFLAPKKYANSSLPATGIKVNELKDDFDASLDLPIYATIQGFKGLDSKVVILFGVEHIHPQNFSKFLYIAGTRARTLLYVVGSEEFWKEHE